MTTIEASGNEPQTTDNETTPPADPGLGMLRAPVAFVSARLMFTPDGKTDIAVLDDALAWAVMAGARVELLAERKYRVALDAVAPADGFARSHKDAGDRLWELAQFVEKRTAGRVVMPYETSQPRTAIIHHKATPARPVRYAVIEGTGTGPRLLADAIGAGLEATPLGIYRFRVEGPTWRYLAWMQTAQGLSRAKVLEMLRITEAQAAEEDAGPAPIRVDLPPRKTVTDLTYEQSTGDIKRVVQTEVTPASGVRP
jgi:hypothetical protein